MNCPYRWLQFSWACVAVCALGCVFLLTSCGTTVTTPKGYTFTVHVDGETAAVLVSKKFGGKEVRRVLP